MRASYLIPSKSLSSLALVSLLLSGCGVYLHDVGLRNVAVEAQEKAGTLDLPSVIATARENRKSLADQQVTLLQRNGTLQAKIRLAQAVTDDQPMALSVWDSKNFATALDELGVTDNKTLDELDAVYSNTAKWEFRLRSRARRVEVYLGIMPTPCLPDFKIPPAEQFAEAVAESGRADFKAIYNDYVKACGKVKVELGNALEPLFNDVNGNPIAAEGLGLIAEAWNNWKKKEVNLETKRAVARDNLVKFKIAERKLSEASAAGPDLAGEITKAEEELRNAVKAFDVICETGATLGSLAPGSSAKDGNLFSNSIICGEKRKALGQLIEAVATGQDPTAADAPKSLKNAAIIAAALPGLVGDVGAALEAGRKVPLASLRLLRAQASIDKEFADRKVERQEERVQQAMLAWRATVAEAHHLWQTRFQLCQATAAVAAGIESELVSIYCTSMTIVTKTDPNDPLKKREFVACSYKLGKWEIVTTVIPGEEPGKETKIEVPTFLPIDDVLNPPDCLLGKTVEVALFDTAVADNIKDALAHYYLAAQSARAAKTEADYRATLIDGDEALDQDERALRLWAELIVVPVNSLASHYEGGLKPETIADTIVTGAGLGAIAVGVN